MGYPSSAMTVEEKILAALARIERKVDGNFKLTYPFILSASIAAIAL
jgi:hypothetical protein